MPFFCLFVCFVVVFLLLFFFLKIRLYFVKISIMMMVSSGSTHEGHLHKNGILTWFGIETTVSDMHTNIKLEEFKN